MGRGEGDNRMSRPPTKFTAAAMQIVRVMAAEGKTASEIARVISSTPNSVSTVCRTHKISLAPGRDNYLGGTVGDGVVKAFRDWAKRHDTSTRQVVLHVLTIVASENLFDAIFDGELPPAKGSREMKHDEAALEA